MKDTLIMRPGLQAFRAFFILLVEKRTKLTADESNHEDRHRSVERRPAGGGASIILQQCTYWLCGGILPPALGIAGGIFSVHSLWSSRSGWWHISNFLHFVVFVVLRNFNNDIESQQASPSQ